MFAAAATPAAQIQRADDNQEEPILNYRRYCRGASFLPPGALISCGTLCQKFLALGTTAGTVHIFELQGRGAEWRRIACHNSRINDVSTDIVRYRDVPFLIAFQCARPATAPAHSIPASRTHFHL